MDPILEVAVDSLRDSVCKLLKTFGGAEGTRTPDPLNAIYNKNPTTTSFQQPRSARRGETRKKTALSAPYTHPQYQFQPRLNLVSHLPDFRV